LNLSNFLINNPRHVSLLWNLLAQQAIKVLITASLLASKWSGKVSNAVEFFDLSSRALQILSYPNRSLPLPWSHRT
jgi:hypothetical protein